MGRKSHTLRRILIMVSAGDFRNGLTIEFEGNVYQVIEFQHVKPGRVQRS